MTIGPAKSIKEACKHSSGALIRLSKDPGFSSRFNIVVMDYDEACIMRLTPELVQNFPKAVGV